MVEVTATLQKWVLMLVSIFQMWKLRPNEVGWFTQ